MRLLSLREEANMFIVGIVVCLLHTLTSTDAAFTWTHSDASVDFIQGQTAKLVWTVDTSPKWARVDINRNKIKSTFGQETVIDITESTGAKIKHLSGRNADIDLVVEGAANVANVTLTLRNLVKTTDEMYYSIKLALSDFTTDIKYTFLKVLVLPGKAGLQLHSNKTVFCRNDIINMTCNALNGTPSETDLMFIKNNSIITTIAGSQSGNYSNAVLTKELNETGTFSWSCQAKNVDGASPPSGAVTITVTDPPEFTSCTSMTVVEKNDLVWTCDVSGSQPLNISWFKGNTSAVIQSGKSLNITTVNRTDSGMYRLTASNGGECPTASKTVYLDVHFLPGTPVLQVHPDKPVFCQGDTINITCNGVTGHPKLTTLAFLQNNSSIGMLNGAISGNYTKAVLSHALTQPGTLTFSCNATNAAGSSATSNVVTITVKDPAVITSCKRMTVLEKENLVWECDVSGSQPLNTSWFKGNTSTVIQSGKSLNITTVNRADSGMYRFTASNGGECPTASKIVYLDVQFLPLKPVLQLHPNNPVFCKGDTINITCNGVPGHPTLTNLTFLQNDSSIGMLNVATSGNYTEVVLSHDLTQLRTLAFSCNATNAAGSSPTSNVVTITVKDPPVITSCTDITVVEKKNLSWTCGVSGSLPLTTTWFKGNTSTVIQSGKSLNITAVNKTDSGMYRFTASNGGECLTASKTVYLDVHYKPEQLSVDIAQKGFIDINKTDTINITCSAKGNPEPYYYWVFNGKPLSSLRNDTITISNAAKGNAGKYTCTAVNAVGNETIAVTVRVHYIEQATCNADPNPVKENESLALNCSASGYPPVNYIWTFSTKVINQPIVNETATTSLNGVNMTCTAMNSRGSKTCTKTITVHYMPRSVQVVPASVPALEINGSFNLNCSASSNPDGNYTWSLNGVTLDGKTKNVLTKDNITLQDAGEYTCTVTNSVGSGTSNKVTINVNYIGEATCDAKPNPVKENENFALICSAAGYPAVNYTWTLPGSAVYQQNTTVNATQSLNGVDMKCKAMNSRGSKNCTKTITVHYKPRKVQVVPASVPALNISGSFNLTCNAFSNPDGNYTWSKNGVPLAGKNDRVLIKDNIKPNDTGVYTCTVANKEGNGTGNKVTINVNYKPTMQKCVPVLRLPDNTSFDFSCEKPKGFPPPSYTTLFNGTSYNASINITIDRVTKALNRLVIQCSASNMLGSVSCNTTLIVESETYKWNCSLRLINYTYVKNMSDSNSNVFKTTSAKVGNIIKEGFNGSKNFNSAKVLSLKNGSVIVNFQLELTANVSDPLLPLKEALKKSGGALGGYSIDPNSIQQGFYVPPPTTSPPTTTTPTTTPSQKVESGSDGLSTEAIIGIAIGCCVLLILFIILLIYCCYCKKRRECKDDKFAEDGQNVPMEGIDNKGSSHSPSTYAKHGPGVNGNNNAGNGNDIYAQVDKSKKTKKAPADEVLYADLSLVRGDNQSGDAQLAHMPSSGNQPEKYESNYAEITGVIRSIETPKENESADNSNKNEKNPENAEKESEAEEQAKDKNQDGSTSTSQTVDNAVKNDNASGSQINVETKGTSSSATHYADWQSTKDRDHTTLTNVSM